MLKYFHNNQIIKQNNIFYIDSCNCGKAKMHNIEAHIAHGQVAHPTKYPWIVRLFFKTTKRNIIGRPVISNKPICTGSLVTEQHVLTAAHCISHPGAPGRYTVYVGNDMNNPLKVERINVHESFNKECYPLKCEGHDVAVLTMKYLYPDGIPICLPSNPGASYDGHTAVEAGYGFDEHGKHGFGASKGARPGGPQLLETSVVIVSSSQCSHQWRKE